MRNLAVPASDRSRHAEAESLSRRSLAILVKVLGPHDAEVGLTLHNVGVALAEQGRPQEAVNLFGRANRILAAALPEDHPHREAARASQQRVLGGG